MSEELDVAGYELVKDIENGGTASFYYGYDPRTSLSSDVYKTVNPLMRREDVEQLIQQKLNDAELYEDHPLYDVLYHLKEKVKPKDD